jgi:serine/threonine protein kinase
MMNGLHYMHSKGYAHRDIKPENVLLSQLFVLKIADFGFSCLLRGKDGTGVLKTKLGTEGYMAPEIPTKKYEGKSCDIFASGVILFIMFAGNPPFEKASPTDPYYKLIREKKYDIFWKAHSRKRPAGFFSESFKELFVKVVAYEPLERPKIEQIAAHPWVREAICSHNEIKEEFTQRQKKLDGVLEARRQEQ